MARHIGGTGYGLALQYIYNSIASSVYDWQVFGGTDQTDFRNFVNVWHHHLYVFKPEGILLGYLDGALKVKQNFNLAFPKIFSGSFFINKYFSGLVDDFAIFSGDMGPYVSALQASPANLVLVEQTESTKIASLVIMGRIAAIIHIKTALQTKLLL